MSLTFKGNSYDTPPPFVGIALITVEMQTMKDRKTFFRISLPVQELSNQAGWFAEEEAAENTSHQSPSNSSLVFLLWQEIWFGLVPWTATWNLLLFFGFLNLGLKGQILPSALSQDTKCMLFVFSYPSLWFTKHFKRS